MAVTRSTQIHERTRKQTCGGSSKAHKLDGASTTTSTKHKYRICCTSKRKHTLAPSRLSYVWCCDDFQVDRCIKWVVEWEAAKDQGSF